MFRDSEILGAIAGLQSIVRTMQKEIDAMNDKITIEFDDIKERNSIIYDIVDTLKEKINTHIDRHMKMHKDDNDLKFIFKEAMAEFRKELGDETKKEKKVAKKK